MIPDHEHLYHVEQNPCSKLGKWKGRENPLQNFGKRRFLKPSLPFVNLQTKIKALQSCLGLDWGELCEPKGRSSKVVFA